MDKAMYVGILIGQLHESPSGPFIRYDAVLGDCIVIVVPVIGRGRRSSAEACEQL